MKVIKEQQQLLFYFFDPISNFGSYKNEIAESVYFEYVCLPVSQLYIFGNGSIIFFVIFAILENQKIR